tara:strand:- start:46 stop:252 length:207 start_codon:yes stop_codon:yes gene_type:complete
MAKITVRDNGPLLVEDENATVCDMSGEEFIVQGSTFALCRCGASEKKPFCDGTHGRVGFQASERATAE